MNFTQVSASFFSNASYWKGTKRLDMQLHHKYFTGGKSINQSDFNGKCILIVQFQVYNLQLTA